MFQSIRERWKRGIVTRKARHAENWSLKDVADRLSDDQRPKSHLGNRVYTSANEFAPALKLPSHPPEIRAVSRHVSSFTSMHSEGCGLRSQQSFSYLHEGSSKDSARLMDRSTLVEKRYNKFALPSTRHCYWKNNAHKSVRLF